MSWKPKERLDGSTTKAFGKYLVGRGDDTDTRFDENQFLEMRTRIKTKNQMKAIFMLGLLRDSKLSTQAAPLMANLFNREAISIDGEGRKEGVAVLLGPQPVSSQGILEGYSNVVPKEWATKKE